MINHPSPRLRVINHPSPRLRVINHPSPRLRVINHPSPRLRVINHPSPRLRVINPTPRRAGRDTPRPDSTHANRVCAGPGGGGHSYVPVAGQVPLHWRGAPIPGPRATCRVGGWGGVVRERGGADAARILTPSYRRRPG